MNDTTNSTPEAPEKNAALTRKIEYATFNSRMMAAIFDVLAVTLVSYPVIQWLESLFFHPIDIGVIAGLLQAPLTSEERTKLFLQVMREQHVLAIIIINNLLQFISLALYILPFWFKKKNTPGKMLMRIEIRDAATYELMTRKQAVGRFLGYVVSGIPFTLGFLWMAFSKKKQCWHDNMAGTIVVKREKKKKDKSSA